MAAMNPCPCGYLGHPQRSCIDTAQSVTRYQQKLSGPFVDRLDLIVPVIPAKSEELAQRAPGESTREIHARVAAARLRQRARLRGMPWRTNAEIPAHDGVMERVCPLSEEAQRLLSSLARTRMLSPRAQHRIRRVARTIEDLSLHVCADAPDAPVSAESVARAAHLRRLPDLGEG